MSGVESVRETNVSRVDEDDSGGTRELLVKGRRVGSSNSFRAHGVDENWDLVCSCLTSPKRCRDFEVVMILASYSV